jgi:DNA-binding NarL/FixJ family response regulator
MSLDLILLDLNVPGVQGFSGLLYLRAQYPHIPVVIVSATEDPGTVRRSLDLGASGFIPKSQPVDQIRAALRRIMNGEVWFPEDVDASGVEEETRVLAARLARLTPQQMRVLMMLSEGLLNKQIAYNLNVSEATVKAHVSAILQKLDVDSRTQAVIAINRLSAADRAG